LSGPFSRRRPILGEERSKSREIRRLAELGRFVRPYRKVAIASIVALACTAGAVLAMPFGARLLIDRGFHEDGGGGLNVALLVLFGLVAVLSIATFARFYLVSWLGERIVADMRRAVYDHVISLSPSFFEVTKIGEVLSRLTTDTTLLQTVISTQASQALRNLLMLLGGTAMMLVTSPKLTGMVLLIVPAVVLPIAFFGRRVRSLSRATQDRIGDLGAQIEETLNSVQTVQAFAQEDVERGRFGSGVESAFATALRMVRARAWLTALVILIVFSGIGFVLWVGGHDVIAGQITAGELLSFLLYSVVVAASVGALSEVYGDLQRAAGAAERLADLLRIQPDIDAPATPRDLPEPALGEVELDAVTFHYPARPEQAALDGFTLNVATGETVALVGPSGAGKTTVFSLLLRFYDPEHGIVRLDGVDVRAAVPAEVRARFGLVPQAPVLFATDAWTNIRYGRPEASDAEVRAAAEAAGALEFLDALPDGFSSFLGEKGVRLSGGQRQRIAIARAVLRNPAILLLDEATSALDAESEQAVQAALERLMAGRTTLVIAHRLATVLKADRIVVIDQGRAVAEGSHHDLIAQGGLYARLAALQFDAGGEAANPVSAE